MSDEDTNRLSTFIHNETLSIQRSTRRTIVFGGVLALLIAGYMGFVIFMLKGFLEPQALAMVVADQVAETLPDVINSAELTLRAKAPELANQITDSFMQAIPKMAETGKQEIDLAYQERIPYINEEFKNIVRDYIEDNSEELVAFTETHSAEAFAQYFTEQMMVELGVQLEQRLNDSHARTSNLKYFSNNLTYSLLAMNTTLDEFLHQDINQLTRQERLQRRILARLVQSAHESAAE